MLKKGRKREAKGLAVLYFIIGLIILLIILAVIYFALAKLDYSDQVDPEATMRSYVEATPEPVGIPDDVAVASDEVPEYVMPEDEVDLTQNLEVYPTEEEEAPTLEPTEEPTPEPTPAPTPEPTALPAGSAAQPMTDIPNLPATASENGKQGITGCYVSAPDDNKLMVITGYGYANVEGFDGAQAKSWLVVTQVASGQKVAYPLNLVNGASGLPHDGAVCQNPAACDFQITIDVSQYQEGIYSMALVIGYKLPDAKDASFAYYPFGGDVSFTILDGKVITPVNTVDYE